MSEPDKIKALYLMRDLHPGVSSEVQCARIRSALGRFSITTFEAMRYLDVYDPRARVMQLRNAGDAIDTHWQTVITEAGERHRVGVYTLRPKAGAVA
jgi:hypothetical protein